MLSGLHSRWYGFAQWTLVRGFLGQLVFFVAKSVPHFVTLWKKIQWYCSKSPDQLTLCPISSSKFADICCLIQTTQQKAQMIQGIGHTIHTLQSWWDLWGCRIGISRRWPSPNPRKMHNYYPWLTSHWSARCCWWATRNPGRTHQLRLVV